MKLIDGMGQIGKSLSERVIAEDVTIYHKWNFIDKSETVQKECYNDFADYMHKHARERIIFISTYTTDYSSYYHYKMKAELYLLRNTDGKVVRLPGLIGKGVCSKLSKGEIYPYGLMEVATIHDATDYICNSIEAPERICTMKGAVISAETILELIDYRIRHEN